MLRSAVVLAMSSACAASPDWAAHWRETPCSIAVSAPDVERPEQIVYLGADGRVAFVWLFGNDGILETVAQRHTYAADGRLTSIEAHEIRRDPRDFVESETEDALGDGRPHFVHRVDVAYDDDGRARVQRTVTRYAPHPRGGWQPIETRTALRDQCGVLDAWGRPIDPRVRVSAPTGAGCASLPPPPPSSERPGAVCVTAPFGGIRHCL